jgi:hypothetical protein
MAAASFTRTPAPYLNRLENFETRALLGIGLGNSFDVTDAERVLGHSPGSACKQALDMATKGYYEAEYAMSADTNTAGVINLTTGLLVDFLTVGRSRLVEWDAYIKADVDAALIENSAHVACAATPIVYVQRNTIDVGDALVTQNVDVRSIAAGDLLSTLVTIPTAALSVSTADVILTLTGVTDIDTRWVVKVRIYPCITLPLIATT